MIILKIVTAVLGLMFSLFGYSIYFQRKYNLINGFEVDYQRGFKDEKYAKRVGLIEFIVGIVFLVSSIVLIIFA